ncbi:hypothetical protein MRB53_018806 [Persea americana]|uniref:Uncharacterized protein n=1 Tax=Persea americana TaxID=3435 RepID=A0ACC2M8Z2_PERAE|nr:hypothetical protein MRB53_018806 [Persea americana]
MKMVAHILVVVFLSITSSVVYADDPSPLQDICVADLNSEASTSCHIGFNLYFSISGHQTTVTKSVLNVFGAEKVQSKQICCSLCSFDVVKMTKYGGVIWVTMFYDSLLF